MAFYIKNSETGLLHPCSKIHYLLGTVIQKLQGLNINEQFQ